MGSRRRKSCSGARVLDGARVAVGSIVAVVVGACVAQYVQVEIFFSWGIQILDSPILIFFGIGRLFFGGGFFFYTQVFSDRYTFRGL